MPFQPVKAESLSAQVFETIRNAIFRGELKPGETLRELGLAKSLNVSQATVREALAHLEQFGLVVRTPNRSTNVTAFSNQEVVQRERIRLALECLAFLEARDKITPDQLEGLTSLSQNAVEAMNAGDPAALIQAERNFHSAVWHISGNTVLVRMLDQLTTPLFVRRAMNGNRLAHMADYPGLVEQLRHGDKDSIVAALQKHILDPDVASEQHQPQPPAAEEEGQAVVIGSSNPV